MRDEKYHFSHTNYWTHTGSRLASNRCQCIRTWFHCPREMHSVQQCRLCWTYNLEALLTSLSFKIYVTEKRRLGARDRDLKKRPKIKVIKVKITASDFKLSHSSQQSALTESRPDRTRQPSTVGWGHPFTLRNAPVQQQRFHHTAENVICN